MIDGGGSIFRSRGNKNKKQQLDCPEDLNPKTTYRVLGVVSIPISQPLPINTSHSSCPILWF